VPVRRAGRRAQAVVGRQVARLVVAESGEVIEERWRNWRRHDPINLVAKYRANLKSLRGIYVEFLYKALNLSHFVVVAATSISGMRYRAGR